MKTLFLMLFFGLTSLAQAQLIHPTKPPENELDVTKQKNASMKGVISHFVKTTSDEIVKCSDGASAKQTDFIQLYNYISLKVNELEKRPACDDKFLKCLVTEEFSSKISQIVGHEKFVPLMKHEYSISRKSARQMRKFYKQLIKDVKAK